MSNVSITLEQLGAWENAVMLNIRDFFSTFVNNDHDPWGICSIRFGKTSVSFIYIDSADHLISDSMPMEQFLTWYKGHV